MYILCCILILFQLFNDFKWWCNPLTSNDQVVINRASEEDEATIFNIMERSSKI